MEPDKKSNGALIGAIIVIVILLIGGIYVWSQREAEVPAGTEVTPADSQELDALEEDLNSFNADIEVSAVESVE